MRGESGCNNGVFMKTYITYPTCSTGLKFGVFGVRVRYEYVSFRDSRKKLDITVFSVYLRVNNYFLTSFLVKNKNKVCLSN